MILTAAEARVSLGLFSSISDLDRALLETLMPKVDAAIIEHLQYDPQYFADTDGEYYPRNWQREAASEGLWEVTATRAVYAGRGRNDTIQAQRIPIRSIEEVRIDFTGGFGQRPNTFGDDKIRLAGIDYWHDLLSPYFNATGHIFAFAGWPVQPGSVLIKYTAGYTKRELSGQAIRTENDPETSRAGSGFNASGIKEAAELTLVKAFRQRKLLGKQATGGFTAGPITSERLGDYSYSVSEAIARDLASMKVSLPAEAKEKLEPFRHYGIIQI
jgi:hypothetical protein